MWCRTRARRAARSAAIVTLVALLLAPAATAQRRAPAGALPACDSACAADSAAVVARLWLAPTLAPRWRAVPIALLVGALDRDPGGYADRWTGGGPHPQDRLLAPDKRDHVWLGAALAAALDDGWRGVLPTCAAGAAFELGQMRPARFPAAWRGDRAGYGSWRDAAVTCGGAAAGVGARALWRRWRGGPGNDDAAPGGGGI